MSPRSLEDTSLPDLEQGVRVVLGWLYLANHNSAIMFKTPPKSDRNSEIYALYQNGLSIPKLARRYGISNARAHQILKNIGEFMFPNIREREMIMFSKFASVKTLMNVDKLAAVARTNLAMISVASNLYPADPILRVVLSIANL